MSLVRPSRRLRQTTNDPWFAAANLLLRRRAPGLASELLNGLRLDVKAILVDQGSGFGGSRPAGGGSPAAQPALVLTDSRHGRLTT